MADDPRPDPSQGVFETLLVLDGRPVELEAHLERLEASLAELYPSSAPPAIGEEMLARVLDITLGSIRVTVALKGDDRLAAEISARKIERGSFLPLGALFPLSGKKAPIRAVALRCFALTGGLGPHKWADRRLLDEMQAALPAGTLPLIVDDGTALEASRANLFAVRDGTLLTPPLDGRILPGITRMRVLEIAAATGLEAAEGELSRDDLLAAEEVFLTGSVRGVEVVGCLDGEPLHSSGEIAGHLDIELWRSWAGATATL